MINGYFKFGLDDEALKFFSQAIKDGVVPNSKTFVCVLNLCSRRLDFELGRQVHARVVKGNWRNLIVDSAVVYFYVQCGDLKSAFCVFDRMVERDVVSWTTGFTASGILKACGEEKALKFGKQIHGFFKSFQWDEEKEHGYMDIHYSRNLVTWRAMIMGYVRNGLCQEALKLMYRMQAEGIQVDDYISAKVLGACGEIEWDAGHSSENVLILMEFMLPG
ncbi:hypothetical protein NC653_014109 [Populus alba x Populus x berolinensis]|uniref:Pentatricopeptide repeat-containing protein n=1 Tax=Populus alba x Populus x berolinensis TaxID=444605 RepID=A0AAD6QXG5_9ROSI|nr:hypothetical protein NC653_014109 [Populus alba x Populus x berolinensis]